MLKELANKYNLDYEFIKTNYQKYRDNIFTKQEKEEFKSKIRINQKFKTFEEKDKIYVEILQEFDLIKKQETDYGKFVNKNN